MRVITGSARGRKLIAPEGMDVRPTTDKVKEAVFSAIQFDIEGAYVLDLFAGSGQMGIEALSRGAKRAVFVDNSQKALRCVNNNLRSTALERYADVVNRDSYDYIKHINRKFDIIILDPPYRYNHINNILPFVSPKLNDGGFVICEYESDSEIDIIPDELKLKKTYRYGKINITILYKDSAEEVQL